MDKHPDYFQFKQFRIYHGSCGLKVGTDGVLLGAWSQLPEGKMRRVLDVGCGTGLISIMLAQRFADAHITGIDIDVNAVSQAASNAALSPWSERLSFHQGDIADYANSFSRPQFDAIVSNPPFFEESFLPPSSARAAARHTSFMPLPRLADAAATLLNTEKGLFCTILPAVSASSFIDLCADRGLQLIRFTRVLTSTHRPPKRALLCFQLTDSHPQYVAVSTLPLFGNGPHGRSTAYEALTKDFYL